MPRCGTLEYLFLSDDMTGSEQLYLMYFAISAGFCAGLFISVLLHWMHPD